MDWTNLGNWIAANTDFTPLVESRKSVGGGCINEAWLIPTSNDRRIFVKVNSRQNFDLFEAEIRGLLQLREAGAIRVPEPYACGAVGDHAILVMEAITLFSWQDAGHQSRLGRQLAELHEVTSSDGTFGNTYQNHIGRTPQNNEPSANWADFFAQRRIDFQLQLAAKNGWNIEERAELLCVVREILNGAGASEPSLLHGDLWSGNVAFDESGNPVIFDPACYFGDREAEIAFTRMFGGFSPAFYRAYREIHQLPEREALLHRLYNLYHELNHFALFGGGYRQQAAETIRLILAS